uniref:SCP domain-containing protein n=1 Tax=Strongyloides papillosus TaxID=174720 RepID=A0A0N5B5U7_STREA
MNIFYSNYYITFIILSILFYQYQAFESNVKGDDSESSSLFQNDLSSKNNIKQDSMVGSLTENGELNYLQKRQANLKSRQKKSKKTNSRTTSRFKITTKKKPLSGKISPRKTTSRKATPRKTTSRKTAPRKTTSRNMTTRKTTKKPSILKTTRKVHPKSTTSTKKPTTTTTKPKKKPKVNTTTTTRKSKTSKTVATKTSSIQPMVTTSTTMIPTTTTSVTTTEKPDELNKFINKTINDINELRAKFKRTPLVVDNELVKEAQNYSNYFVGDTDEVEPYENDGRLQYICPKQYLADFDAVKSWTSNDYDEIIDNSEEKYNYPEFGQLIAEQSTKIGCGINKTEEFTAIFCRIQPTFNSDDEDYE